MTDPDHGRIIDAHTERTLADVGLPGYFLAQSVDTAGVVDLWVADRTQVGNLDADHGNESPPHERLGPLPAPWHGRVAAVPIRCGRPTAAGRACRAIVAEAGRTCPHHRAVVR